MRPDLQHEATYHSLLCDFVPNVWSVKVRHNYMYVSYFLQIRKSSLLICASLISHPSLDCLTVEDGTDSCTETTVTTHLHCITSQKRKDLNCTMAEAWYHASYY